MYVQLLASLLMVAAIASIEQHSSALLAGQMASAMNGTTRCTASRADH
jgi:hypothetical protein